MTEAPLRLGRPHPPADQGPVITGSIEAAARPVPRRSDAGKIRYTERDVTGLLLLAEHYAGVVRPAAAALSAPARGPRGRRPLAAAWRPAAVRARPGVVLATTAGGVR